MPPARAPVTYIAPMSHAPGEGPDLRGRTERDRRILTVMLAGVLAVGVVVSWLILVEAWRGSGDPAMFPDPSADVPRAFFMAEFLQYAFYTAGTAGLPALTLVAAGALLVLFFPPHGLGLSARGRRTALLLVGAATLAVSLTVAVRLGFILYAKTSVPDELVGVYFAPTTGLAALLAVLGPAGELLAWSVVIQLWLTRWRLDDGDDGDDAEEADIGIHVAVEDPDEGRPLDGTERERPASHPQDTTLHESRDPARLRPDGSSDSGFDEFHFRR